MSWLPGWDTATSAHWWSNIYFAASIIALILLGVFEVISHRYSERKDELAATDQQRIQDQHDKDMAALHLKASEAQERAEKLERENLEIRQKVAGRRISKEQHDILVTILAAQPSAFDINTVGEGEATLFAADIMKALSDAGWTPRGKYFPIGMAWQNLSVSSSTDAASARLLGAFQAAGLGVSWFTEKGEGDVPTIWVGSKPPPF